MKKIILSSAFQLMCTFGYKIRKIISITTISSLFFGVSLLFSCSKKDKNMEPSPEKTIQFKTDSSRVKPGTLVTLTSDEASDLSAITITLGGKQVQIVKIDSFQYVFCMPVLPTGNYTIDLSKLKATNNPSVTMSDYTIITNPTNTIMQTITHYNKIADSLVTAGTVSTKEGEFMHQLTDQLSEYMNNSDANEKQLIAYQAQDVLAQTNNSIAKLRSPLGVLSNNKYKIATDKSTTTYPMMSSFANDHAKTSASGNNPFDWINLSPDNSNEFSDKSIKAAHASSGARFALDGGFKGLALASALAVLPQIPPVPGMTIGAAAGGTMLILSAIVLKVYARRLNEEIANEQYVPEHIENSESNTPVVFSKANEIVQKLTGGFRNITKSDENTSTLEIAGYIQSNNDLAATDNKIKTKIDEIKAKFGFLLSKVKGTYNTYISPVLITAKEKTKRLIPKYITISNVSNSDIDIKAGEDAYQQLLLSATNHKNNIKTKVSFTYTTTYTQPATGKKVSITQQATFDGDTAKSDSIIMGNWRYYYNYQGTVFPYEQWFLRDGYYSRISGFATVSTNRNISYHRTYSWYKANDPNNIHSTTVDFNGGKLTGTLSGADSYEVNINNSTLNIVEDGVRKEGRPEHSVARAVMINGTQYLDIIVQYTWNGLNFSISDVFKRD